MGLPPPFVFTNVWWCICLGPNFWNEPLSFTKNEAVALESQASLVLPGLLPAHRRPAEGCGHTGSPLTSPHQRDARWSQHLATLLSEHRVLQYLCCSMWQNFLILGGRQTWLCISLILAPSRGFQSPFWKLGEKEPKLTVISSWFGPQVLSFLPYFTGFSWHVWVFCYVEKQICFLSKQFQPMVYHILLPSLAHSGRQLFHYSISCLSDLSLAFGPQPSFTDRLSRCLNKPHQLY